MFCIHAKRVGLAKLDDNNSGGVGVCDLGQVSPGQIDVFKCYSNENLPSTFYGTVSCCIPSVHFVPANLTL